MTDILTVIWKEWRSFFRTREKRLQTTMTLFVPLAFFGIVMPWQTGHGWLEAFHPILASVTMPLLMVTLTAPDSFAGERERHTLPTLLASRLPDSAILWGKIIWNLAFAWGLALAALVLGLVTANVAIWEGSPLFYSGWVAASSIGLSFLLTLFFVGISIPISLRATTTQEAMHLLGAALLLPPIVAIVVLIMLKRVNEDWSLGVWLANYGNGFIVSVVLVVLAVADTCLLRWARHAFRRAKLITR